jgi:hypothetical protein
MASMQEPDLRVTIEDGRIVVTMVGTHLQAAFAKAPPPHEHMLMQLPIVMTDQSATVSTDEFEAMAWETPNAKARELGWID